MSKKKHKKGKKKDRVTWQLTRAEIDEWGKRFEGLAEITNAMYGLGSGAVWTTYSDEMMARELSIRGLAVVGDSPRSDGWDPPLACPGCALCRPFKFTMTEEWAGGPAPHGSIAAAKARTPLGPESTDYDEYRRRVAEQEARDRAAFTGGGS